MTDKMTINLEWGEIKTDAHWDKAKAWCEFLGNGWRMPTRHELGLAYEKKVSGFSSYSYWSSSEYGSDYAWYQYFYDGNQYYDSKNDGRRVRAIREVQG